MKSFKVVELRFLEVFVRRARGCGSVCARRGEYACVGITEVAYGVDERPHGYWFPVGGLVVVEGYELANDIVWQVGVGRVFDDAPCVGVGCEQVVDEGDDVLLFDEWFEHVLAEFLK